MNKKKQDPSHLKTRVISLPLTTAQHSMLLAAAQRDHRTLCDYIRSCALMVTTSPKNNSKEEPVWWYDSQGIRQAG